MNLEAFEASLKAEGFDEITTVERPPGYALGEHHHPFDACALITAGDITLMVNSVATRYSAGQIFRLPAGTPHHETVGAEGMQYRVGRRNYAV
jgi:quercetin dioxygenase-like cupin family protein